MAQADIGVNVFLIDSFSSPMALVEGAMAMLSMSLISGIGNAGQMAEQLGVLEEKYAAQSAALVELTLDEDMYNASLARGTMTQAEYDVAMADNAIAQQRQMEAMDATNGSINDLNTNLNVLQGNLTIMGATLGAGIDFAAFTLGLVEADKAASDLTDTMNNLSIAGNMSVQMTDQMQQALFKVANVSMYSADQVGQAFTMLMERGQSAADVINYTGEAVVNMAEAMGQNDATGAATLLAGTMQMFGIKAEDARKTTDMLTYAFYNGIPDVQGLTAAMNSTGGMASALHVPLSELLTMLDALGRAGLSGSQAGTAMRYMLSSMYEPTQKQANELQTLGIITAKQVTPAFEAFLKTMNAASGALGSSTMKFDGTVNSLYQIWANAKQIGTLPASSTFLQWADSVGMLSNKFYDANGKQIDFMSAFGILVQSIKDHSKTPQAFADSLAQMFNVRSGQGFADIVGHISTLSQKQKDLLISTEKQGLAAEDANKKMNSQGNQMKALGTTFTDFLAQAGQPLQDGMVGILKGLNGIIGGFTTGSPAVHQFFTSFLVIGAILSGVALFVGLLMLIGTFASGIIVPVLAVAAGIALVAAGGALLNNWLHSNPAAMAAVQNAFHLVQNVITNVGHIFVAVMQPALAQLQDAWKQLMTALAPALPMIEGIAKVLLILAGGVILAVVLGAIFALRIAIFVVTAVILGLAHEVTQLAGFFQWLGNIGHIVASALTTNWSNATSQIGGFFHGLGSTISNFINGAVQWGANLIAGFIQGIESKIPGLTGIVNGVAGLIHNVLGIHSPAKEGPLSTADQWMPNMMNMFVHGIVSGSPAVSAAAHGAALGMRGSFTSPSVTSAQGIGAGVGAGGANGTSISTYNLILDSKTLGQWTVDNISKQLTQNGVGRTLR